MNEFYQEAKIFYINNKNESITSVCKKFKIDRGSFSKYLKKEKIETNRRRKYYLDESTFNIINSEEKAYWLGFFLADTCIKGRNNSMFSISLKKEDSYILKDLNSFLKSNYPIKEERIKLKEKTYETSSLRISSKPFCESLEKFGIINNKTFKTTFNYNNEVPKEFLSSYLRGIFDGDGWFSNSLHTKGKSKELGFCGTKEICEGIQLLLLNELNVRTNLSKIKKIYRIRISNKDDILKVYNYLYKNKTYYLKRKYEKIKEFAALSETTK